MKELIKPNKIEESYKELASLCEQYCNTDTRRVCDKFCTGQGTTNASLDDDNTILF